MSCSYFLFAGLEQARNVVHGRVQQDQHRPTVLTGTPVAGMVYLDRPSPAGYFIFPDLSVRHEGKYRLNFHLFEETKEPKDEDRIDDAAKPNGWQNGYSTHRLEVRSVPFTVYSAKKFPGLAESTSLSRIVAEQGCRVRIRRDVRMRRRDNKSGKDWDGYEEETSELRARMSATPEAPGFPGHTYMEPIPRPRSGSNASHLSLAPSLSRRHSLQDINQGFHQATYGTAPHTPQNAYPQSSPYITGPSSNQPYGPPPFVQQQSSMQPPAPSYHQQSHQPAPPLPPAPTSHQSYYGYAPAPPPVFEARQSADYSSQVATDHHRSSNLYAPAAVQALPQPSYAPAQTHPMYQSQAAPQPGYQQSHTYQPTYASQHAHQSSLGSLDGYNSRPAPAEPVQPPMRTTGAHTPLSTRPFNDKLPPLNTTFNVSSVKSIEPSSPVSLSQTSHYSASQAPMDSHKRNFGQVFNERHLTRPLRQGARPSPLDYGNQLYAAADEDPLQDIDFEKTMVYRRADGRQVNRNLPRHD